MPNTLPACLEFKPELWYSLNNIVNAEKEMEALHLQESGEMYLETIYVLSRRGGAVRAIDVSDYMGYSKPSVSRAVSILKNGGYLAADVSGALVLTKAGLEVAERTYERHRVLTELFVRLGVNPQTAAEDACKLEHDISDESFKAVKTFINEN